MAVNELTFFTLTDDSISKNQSILVKLNKTAEK